jgi:predicted GNAT family acetyltransferase
MDWHFENGRIWSVNNKGELLAEATYVPSGNSEININHTYVNPTLRGQGVAGELMCAVAEYLRAHQLKATATCSYACHWLDKNKETNLDIIA